MTPKGSGAVCSCQATEPLCHGASGYGHPQALVACGISMWLGLQGPSELPEFHGLAASSYKGPRRGCT